MTNRLMAAVLAAAVTLSLGAAELEKGKTDIVVARSATDVVEFAAEELQTFLSEALGEKVPIVKKPTTGRTAVILGVNEWSSAAGLDPAKCPRDTFIVRSEKDRVYISGVDEQDKRFKTLKTTRNSSVQRGTLHGVYAFLEKYAGVRFYFPGELGTIVPKTDAIRVPEGEETITPAYDIREWYTDPKFAWIGAEGPSAEGARNLNLSWLRLRMGTHRIPLCHGTRRFRYLERFGESHPEYFALKPNGSRHNDANATHPGHFCWNSPIVEEIYRDVKCALTGGKPSERGIPGADWPQNVDLKFRYVDIMPQDGQANCVCPVCTAQRERGENAVWAATAKIARRLQEEGVSGSVTQMAYGRNRDVPAFDLPTNIAIQVAVGGAWSMGDPEKAAAERKVVADWVKKLGHKVWLWNYQCKSGPMRPLKGIPQLSMRCWGEYYKTMPDLIIGAFAESETERFSFNYLNWYVYSRVCWDTSADIEAILDEHFRLMFGAGAPEMAAYYGELERKWTREVVGKTRDTPLGPERLVPSLETLFTKIYSEDELKKLDALVAAALRKVAPDSLEARRIRLFADEYVGSIRRAAKAYFDRIAAVKNFRVKASKTDAIPLRIIDLKGRKAQIDRPLACAVTTWKDDKALHYRYVCEEPAMDHVVDMERPAGDANVWQDNCVELHLCPAGDRMDVCHIMLNSRGSLYADRYRLLGESGRDHDREWGKTVRAAVTRGRDSWTAEITIPLAEFKTLVADVPTSFSRSRMVDGMSGSAFYIWGPETITSFVDSMNFGTVEYAAKPKDPRRVNAPWGTETRVTNICYLEGADLKEANDYRRQMCKLDFKYPQDVTGFPTVVWFHGGGLTRGNKYFPGLDGRHLGVITANYRLIGQDGITGAAEPISDAAAAVAWALRHVAEYGGDPKRVFVSGMSAGGYLTMMVGMDPQWLAKQGFALSDLAGLAPDSGQATTHFAIKEFRKDPRPGCRPVIDEWAPIWHCSTNVPPIVCITGEPGHEWPGRAEENELLIGTLKALGHKKAWYVRMPYATHGWAATCGEPYIELFAFGTYPEQ